MFTEEEKRYIKQDTMTTQMLYVANKCRKENKRVIWLNGHLQMISKEEK